MSKTTPKTINTAKTITKTKTTATPITTAITTATPKTIQKTESNNNSNLNINSEEDLQDYFHSVHSFIRNKFGLYGKAALQFFNFFFVLKVIGAIYCKWTN